MLVVEFAAAFVIILVLGYIVPAGRYYYCYHVRRGPENDGLRIQSRRPRPGQVWEEIRLSLGSIVIIAGVAMLLVEMYRAGWTSLYWPLTAYPLWYFPLSVFLCAVVHDTFFYWSHRFMHWRPVFPYFHLGHDHFVTPTP